jgi:hypothetical protein
MRFTTSTVSIGSGPPRQSERVIVPKRPGNAGGGKDPYFKCASEVVKVR